MQLCYSISSFFRVCEFAVSINDASILYNYISTVLHTLEILRKLVPAAKFGNLRGFWVRPESDALLYNKPLASVCLCICVSVCVLPVNVQGNGPIVTKLGMSLDGHLGRDIGLLKWTSLNRKWRHRAESGTTPLLWTLSETFCWS